jgi:hypothetical protein
MWLPFLAFSLGYFIPSAVANHFGLGPLWEWLILALLLALFLVFLFYSFPLTAQGICHNSDGSAQCLPDREDDRVVAVLRPYSAFDKMLFFSAVGAFIFAVVAFRFISFQVAKFTLLSATLMFLVFLAKRIRVQLIGTRVTLLQFNGDRIKLKTLRNAAFVETEVDREIVLPIDAIKMVRVRTIGGVPADPSYQIILVTWNETNINMTLPFHLSKEASQIVKLLRSRIPGADYDIDEYFADR